MKTVVLGICLLLSLGAFGQEEAAVRRLLQVQVAAWNAGDIEGFMQTYWNSDSLLFVGKSGVTRGWQATLDRYRKSYPGREGMGKLAFAIIELRPLSASRYFVVGKWMLERKAGNLSGHYTLLLEKKIGEWKIVADHSS